MVLCRALCQSTGDEEWTEMHERLNISVQGNGSKDNRTKAAGLGKVAWRKTLKEAFFSAKEEQTGDLFCVCLSWKSGTLTYTNRCVLAKCDMSKGRRVRLSPMTDWTILGLVFSDPDEDSSFFLRVPCFEDSSVFFSCLLNSSEYACLFHREYHVTDVLELDLH